MNVLAATADARQIRRVQRAQAAVCRRYAKTQRGSTRRRWRRLLDIGFGLLFPAFPLLIPLFAWFGAQAGGRAFWGLLACWLALASRGAVFQGHALEFSADDVLRSPSKAGVVLLRLYRHLPRVCFVGLCLAAALAIRLGEALAAHPVPCALLLAVVASNLAQTIGKLVARLHGGRLSVLGPLLPALVFTAHACSWLDGSSKGIVLFVVFGAFAAVLWVGGGIRIAVVCRQRRRVLLRVLACELAILPHTVFAVGLLVPTTMLRETIASPWPGAAALTVMAVATACSLGALMTAVSRAEESTGGSIFAPAVDRPSATAEPIAVSMPARHGPRSLLRAQLYVHRRTHWVRPGVRPGAGSLLALIGHAMGPLLATLVMLISSRRDAPAGLAFLVALTSQSWIAVDLGWQLHRLGIDFAARVRHNLRALVLFAALPTLLAAAVAGTVLGWQDHSERALGALVAAFAWRAGWRGYTRTPEADLRSVGALTGLAAIIALTLLPMPQWWLVLAAIGTGLAGVLLRLRRLDERRIADAMRAAEEVGH
jgi:hypothetical protein